MRRKLARRPGGCQWLTGPGPDPARPVGAVAVGGDAPISVQTMTNTPTTDVAATVAQVQACGDAGADIVRVSMPDEGSTRALREIVRESPVPIVADIHFHYRRAIEAAEAGAACLRINPGNIGVGIFLAGSVGCMFAPGIGALVAARFVQGLGAASVMVIPRAIVRDLHTGPDATRLMALVMLVISVAPMTAPLIGSLMMPIGVADHLRRPGGDGGRLPGG